MTPNTIDFDQVQLGFKSINDPGDVPVIVAVSVVFLLYLIAVVFARRADKRDLEKVWLLKLIFKNNICMCHIIQSLICRIICRNSIHTGSARNYSIFRPAQIGLIFLWGYLSTQDTMAPHTSIDLS